MEAASRVQAGRATTIPPASFGLPGGPASLTASQKQPVKQPLA